MYCAENVDFVQSKLVISNDGKYFKELFVENYPKHAAKNGGFVITAYNRVDLLLFFL